MDTVTACGPTVRHYYINGQLVVVVTGASKGVGTYDSQDFNRFNRFTPYDYEYMLRWTLPRRRVPWDEPAPWYQKLFFPDFPRCQGKLAAITRTIAWLVKSKPSRAEC